MKNVFHQNAAKNVAAWLALFAILLILIAPQISTALQKDPMSMMSGMHHEMSMPMAEHAQMSHVTQEQHPSMPVDHAEACGYCVLLAHVPGLIFLVVLLLLGHAPRLRITPARQAVKHWHFSPWLCPDTRAPPRVCFSCC